MTTTSQIPVETKAAVSCSEMARMCGLSRQRFAQLQGTTFPWPLYDVATRRPFYPEDVQKVCLEVRRRNWGIDDRPILFYAPRVAMTSTVNVTPTKTISKEIKALVRDVKALGLKTVLHTGPYKTALTRRSGRTPCWRRPCGGRSRGG